MDLALRMLLLKPLEALSYSSVVWETLAKRDAPQEMDSMVKQVLEICFPAGYSFKKKTFFFNKKFIELQLIYNDSGVQQSDSVLYIHINKYIYRCSLSHFFHYSLLEDIEYSSLCYRAHPSYLFHIQYCVSVNLKAILNVLLPIISAVNPQRKAAYLTLFTSGLFNFICK